MDSISYRGLPLNVVQSINWERTPQYSDDGITYRDTRWAAELICTLNPGAVSFAAASPPTAQAGQMPALTDVAIRNYLSQPRGQLVVKSLGNVVLSSPGLGGNGQPAACDTRGGPFVRALSVHEVAGERMWQVRLAFETYTRETPGKDVIISNRWSARQEINWQRIGQRIIEGTCIARGDFLRDSNIVGAPNLPGILDSFRNAFCAFSVPPNYQRTSVTVNVSADGQTANYTVVDTEQLFNKNGLVNTYVARVEARDTSWVWHGSWGRAALQAARPGLSAYLPSAWSFGLLPVPGIGAIAVTGSAAWNSMQALGPAIAAQLPKRYKCATVRVWGDRNAARPALTQLALAIASSRLGGRAPFDTTTQEIIVSGDTNNYVEVNWVISWDAQTTLFNAPAGAVIAPFTGATNGAGDTSFAAGVMQATEVSVDGYPGPVLTQKDGSTQTTPNNPPFYDKGTRGTDTALGRLVVQTLEGFNQPPASPAGVGG